MQGALERSTGSGEKLGVERHRGRVPLLALEQEEAGVHEATDEQVELVEPASVLDQPSSFEPGEHEHGTDLSRSSPLHSRTIASQNACR